MPSATRFLSVSLILLSVLILTACLESGEEGQLVITNTTCGPVMGVMTSLPPLTYQLVTRFTAIPYAEPPTGERRFAKPVPKAPWDNVLKATAYGPSCPQPVFDRSFFNDRLPNQDMEEGCLPLNVYVPHDAVASSGPLAVMIFIHGGGLTSGQGMAFDGTLLALHGQIVLVNINYRLGIFGFLSTGDDSAPGNYGLWDQRLAIQWIKDNVASFGGDPGKITIFGESAGGWSVTYQMLSPLKNKSLFQRVIAQSGAAYSNLVIPPVVARSNAYAVATTLGCYLPVGSTSRDLIRCLRGRSMETLLTQTNAVQFAATIDGEFFPTDLNTLLAHPRLGQYDLIMGFNDQEGSLFSREVSGNFTEEKLRTAINDFLRNWHCQCESSDQLTDAVFAYYFGGDDLNEPIENVLRYFDVTADVYFNIPSINFLTRHAQSATATGTYFYYFTYETGKEYFLPLGLADAVPGALHGLDIVYVFGSVGAFYPNDTEAAIFSNRTMDFWTQFARYRNPNGAGSPGSQEWLEFEIENGKYFILDPDFKTGQRFKPDKATFWNEYIPTITVPSYKKPCSYEVPVRKGMLEKSDNKTVEISSKDGEVLGSVVGALRVADEAMGGQEIAQFLGIPYAKPPFGDPRFRPPEDTGPWGDEPLGIPEKLPPACPQDVTKDPWMVRLGFTQTDEDCLTLNIYAPTQDSSDPALPVLVFIHGGEGQEGTSSVYDATLLASQINAVLVVSNYRLGALGFLSTEDEAAPGNSGLHDILATLKWVNKYIGSFGGDPERVTVQGHGTGASLVHMLVLSEKAEGLFSRAVLMSGTAISPIANNPVIPSAAETAKTLAKELECPTESSEEMVSCLRDKPVSDILSVKIGYPFGLAFLTVVDGDLITDNPLELLRAGRINDVDIVVGFTQDEKANVAFGITGFGCPTVTQVQEYIETVSKYSFTNPEKAASALVAEYIDKGGLGDNCKPRGSFRQFINDYLSYWSTLKAARLHADSGRSVFFYSFDLKRVYPQVAPMFGDDLQFVFGDPYSRLVDELQLTYRFEDKRVTLELMAYLKMTIYSGTPGSSLSGEDWPAFDSANLTYMSLTDCPTAISGSVHNWQHLHSFWASYMQLTTAPDPAPTPCIVGMGGLRLSPDKAISIIKGLIAATVLFGVWALIATCVAKMACNGDSDS